jgi:hypothetical protein
MDDSHHRNTGRLAVAVGVVAAGSAISLATYFAMGGPFGTINDIGNAATGVLSAALAWRLRRDSAVRTGDIAVGAALVGSALTVVGSSLVVSGATGFFLAGLVSSVGFAGIGAWLVAVNRTGAGPVAWPRRLRSLGGVAGALMAVGTVAAPGIALRLDDMQAAPGWVWIGFVGWLGIYVVYPAWAFWLGRTETAQARRILRAAERGGAIEDGEVPSWTAG